MQPGDGSAGETPAAPEAPAVVTPVQPAAKPVAEASANLAGTDRFLVYRPYDSLAPSDFEIGPLFPAAGGEPMEAAVSALLAGLLGRKLAADALSEAGLAVATLVLAGELEAAPPITEVRAGAPVRQPGGGASVALRLFTATGSATGFAVLYPDGDGSWLVENLQLDLASLAMPAVRPEPWDPYRMPAP